MQTELITDPTDPEWVQQRSVSGILSLVTRELVLRFLAFAGGVVLARVLQPSTFGIFAMASFAMAVAGLLSELGLAAAFIRRAGDIPRRELDALFTFQLTLTCALSVVLFVAAPAVAWLYRSGELTWLIRALSISLILMSLRTVPIVVSERKLSYGPIVLSDMSGQVAYWVIAVSAALAGWGPWSLVCAVIVSAGIGTAVLYARIRWRPALLFNWESIGGSVRFGVLFQAQTITHFIKDMMIPSFGGLMYGRSAVGYLWWSNQLAAAPLALTHLVSRVSYPALARLQNNSLAYVGMVRSTLLWTCRLSLPAFAVLAGLAPEIVEYIYGSKWATALPALYLFEINMALGVGTGILLPAIYSAGYAATGLRISLGWTALTWASAFVLAWFGLGFQGVAAAYAIGTAVGLLAIVQTVRRLGVHDLGGGLAVPVLSGLGLGALLYAIGPILVHGLPSLAELGSVAMVVGLITNVWGDRHAAIDVVRSAFKAAPS